MQIQMQTIDLGRISSFALLWFTFALFPSADRNRVSPVAQALDPAYARLYGGKMPPDKGFVDGSEISQMRGIDLHVRSLHCEPNAPPRSLDFSHPTMRSVHT